MDVGRDTGTPVVEDYVNKMPFKFTGVLKRVVVEFGQSGVGAIDTRAAGEPLRILTGGLPPLPGASMLDRRRWMREHLDHLRRTLTVGTADAQEGSNLGFRQCWFVRIDA
jgi:hypothetical protein